MLKLILASQSPRRKLLLEKAGFEFHTFSMEISEIINENLSLDDALMKLATEKAQATLDSDNLLNSKGFLILSADTVVVLDKSVIGKPSDLADAKEKLGRISGRTHMVKTAICLIETSDIRKTPTKVVTAIETSEVTFRSLTKEEISDYVETFRPLDKAGAYGVQEMPKGYITEIKGNLDNVMGLPVKLVEESLRRNGWNVARRIL